MPAAASREGNAKGKEEQHERTNHTDTRRKFVYQLYIYPQKTVYQTVYQLGLMCSQYNHAKKHE